MLKVVCIVDKIGTALDRLGKGVAPFHDNIEYYVIDIHPKRPSEEQLYRFESVAKTADVIDAQYYKSMDMLRQRYEWLKDIPTILTHNNPYAIEDGDWNSYTLNVGNNKYIYERLGKITQTPVEYIPLTVDTDFWEYNDDWEPNKNVIMVANRIESKKGILPVAIACNELNLHFILVGAISDKGYFDAIMQSGNVEYHEQISDQDLKNLYYKSTIHVCNSKDNFESGTLPVLESMLCGVPVLTRKVGHMPELYNGENMVINEGDYEDVLAVKDKLFEMISDKKKLAELRDKGWQTAKNRSHKRRAYLYQKLYRQVLFPDSIPVSVVIPAYNRPDTLRECLSAIESQTYGNLEIIVADDSEDGVNSSVVEEFKQYTCKPVRYLYTGKGDYGLARARNEATIHATGEVIVYIDERQIAEPDAIEQFMMRIKPRHWLFGNKGANKDAFVENFSCINREDIINAGLFNERMDCYGGLSQELRVRIRNQGMQTEYVPDAKATPRGKSANRTRKRKEIIRSKDRLFIMGMES